MASYAKWFCVRLWIKKLCVWLPSQPPKNWEFVPVSSNELADVQDDENTFIVDK